MSSDERGAAAADGGERRDPSEKQEPHTVMWGITLRYIPQQPLHYTTLHSPIHYTTTTTTPSLHSTTLHSTTLKMDLSAMQLKERVFWHWIALSVTARIKSMTHRYTISKPSDSETRPLRFCIFTVAFLFVIFVLMASSTSSSMRLNHVWIGTKGRDRWLGWALMIFQNPVCASLCSMFHMFLRVGVSKDCGGTVRVFSWWQYDEASACQWSFISNWTGAFALTRNQGLGAISEGLYGDQLEAMRVPWQEVASSPTWHSVLPLWSNLAAVGLPAIFWTLEHPVFGCCPIVCSSCGKTRLGKRKA